MKPHQPRLFSSLIAASAAILVAGILIVETPKPVRAQSGGYVPGFVKHCPIFLLYAFNGEYTYLTQNCDLCYSDFVSTPFLHDAMGIGCYSCGWSPGCPDPIYVSYLPVIEEEPTESGEGEEPPAEEPPAEEEAPPLEPEEDPAFQEPAYEEPAYEEPAYEEEPYYDPYASLPNAKPILLSGRQFVVAGQREYAPLRFGAPGQSRVPEESLKIRGRYIQHSNDSDFVVQVSFEDGSTRYFRAFELLIESGTSAEKTVTRFGQELDPKNVTDDLPVRTGAVVKSVGEHSHLIRLQSEPDRKFAVTTVKPVRLKK